MYQILINYYYFLQGILISLSSNIIPQFGIFNDNDGDAQPVQEYCPQYQINNGFFASTMAAFENCKESSRLGLLTAHPDQYKKTPEILESYGYPFEIHNVTTEDNYILTVYRIIGSPNLMPEKWAKRKHPVYLAHGILMASDCWNFQPGNRNLPFKLADAGFEVWLGNTRGTSYSLGHNTYNADEDLKYWDFGFHELGVYDVSSVIKKILFESGAEKILYIGHSLGALQLFICLSEIPEQNEKVEAAFLFAPPAIVCHSNHLIRSFVPLLSLHSTLGVVDPLLQGRVGLPHKTFERFNTSLADFCVSSTIQCVICQVTIFANNGINTRQIDPMALANIVAKTGNTASVKSFTQMLQLASCKFRQYDYGSTVNMEKYGSPQPPDYKLENIRSPMYFYYGESDRLVTPPDVIATASRLAPGVLKDLHKIEDDLWNHNDFIYGKNADKLLYNRILDEMEKLSPFYKKKEFDVRKVVSEGKGI